MSEINKFKTYSFSEYVESKIQSWNLKKRIKIKIESQKKDKPYSLLGAGFSKGNGMLILVL